MYVGSFFKTKSDIQMHENFDTHFRKDPPSHNSFRAWHKKLFKMWSVLIRKEVVSHAYVKRTLNKLGKHFNTALTGQHKLLP
jgi:hypothetical protein